MPGAATLRKKSHRGNSRTQLTSQGLSYFVTTVHQILLFYLHDIVLLFVCGNFFAGTGSFMLSKIKITKYRECRCAARLCALPVDLRYEYECRCVLPSTCIQCAVRL